ncbi:MAG: phosphoglycerate kinase [Bdellovibrionota bacterium]
MATPAAVGPTLGLKGIKLIEDFDLKDKRVFIRVDFNVPMEKSKNGGANGVMTITDDTRIRAAIPTIQYALEKGAKIVLASHLGRPESREDIQFSMEPVGLRLGELLKAEVILIDDPTSDAPKSLLPGLRPNQVILLENLRFEKGETDNAREFALQLAEYTDIYINDAFGASHRAHASIEALPKAIENKGIGFLIKREIEMLDVLLQAPKTPYVAILGGAKVSDKIPVIEKMMDKVDTFIVGGAMAFTFLSAKGTAIGKSRVEKDKVSFAREMMERIQVRGKKILLPIDHVITNDFLAPSEIRTTDTAVVPDGYLGVDIGPKTLELYRKELARAQTVFWNGPMGVFEKPEFSKGSFGIAETLSQLTEAMTIVGGGDSAAAAEASGYAGQMTHISTGGGASLEYLQGDKLPGLEVLRNLRPSVQPTL